MSCFLGVRPVGPLGSETLCGPACSNTLCVAWGHPLHWPESRPCPQIHVDLEPRLEEGSLHM